MERFKADAVDSPTEAGYIVVSEAAKEVTWIEKFIDELGMVRSIVNPVKSYCGNDGSIAQENKPQSC